jgi:hypothetical protein
MVLAFPTPRRNFRVTIINGTLQIQNLFPAISLMVPLTEWEMDVRKKVAGFWEKLSQECAGNLSEEHEERFRAIS